MTHPPEVQWISYEAHYTTHLVQVGWRGENEKVAHVSQQLTTQQASKFAASCEKAVKEGRAGFALFSSGWSIYPREEIPDVAALWLS